MRLKRELYPDIKEFIESLGYGVEDDTITLRWDGREAIQYEMPLTLDYVYGSNRSDLFIGAYLQKSGQKLPRRYYPFKSTSEKGVFYVIEEYKGKYKCTCPDNIYTKSDCKHIAQLTNTLVHTNI